MHASDSEKPRFVVLAATDDGEGASEVVRVGANFAHAIPGGELHVVHVVENLPPPARFVPPPRGLGLTAGEILDAAHRHVDDLAAGTRGSFPGPVVTHLAAGSAYKQILQLAIDLQADLILVGTHGRSGIKRMLLGSVAEMVVRKASCPVIVVRAKDYHSFVPPEIEPPCGDCLRTQRESGGARLWCERHSERHPRAHRYYEMPEGFGEGSQLLR